MSRRKTTWDEDDRDGYGRPKVLLPSGKKRQGYTRVTTLIGALDDKSALIPWAQGMTALGLAEAEDLRHEVISNRDDIREVRRIANEAAERAGSKKAREHGSMLHRMTQDIDEGNEPWGATADDLRDLEKYRALTEGCTWTWIEQAIVNDEMKYAGTPDRIGLWPGQSLDRVGDVKTGPDDAGKLEWHALAWSAQIAAYAHGDLYDVESGNRAPLEVDQKYGYVIWLPPRIEACAMLRVDLEVGWRAVQLAKEVRDIRKVKPMEQEFMAGRLPDTIEELRERYKAAGPKEREAILRKVELIKTGEVKSA